jgi:3-oxoacyl-[acyl-carrier-protein] synthase II
MLAVAITGLGVVSAAEPRTTDGAPDIGAWLVGSGGLLDLSPYLEEAHRQTFDRASQLAVVAAKLALDDAGGAPCAPPMLGVCLGNTYGCLGPQIALDRTILTDGPQAISGSLFPYAAFNAASANVAIVLQAKGPNFTLATGLAAGTDACAEAARQVEGGYARAMLAGGVEAFGDDLRCWLEKLKVVRSPTDGAAVVVLESRDDAVRRGARVHAVIAGASSDVADDESVASMGRVAAASARAALEEADVVAGDLRLIVGGDGLFPEVERRVSGRSVEAVWGDTLSASGAFQVAVALRAIRRETDPGPVLCVSRSLEGIVSSIVIMP